MEEVQESENEDEEDKVRKGTGWMNRKNLEGTKNEKRSNGRGFNLW